MMHRPTVEQSTMSWWYIMWATEDAVFKRTSGASGSYATDAPEQYLKSLNKNYQPKGAVLHQNTCGHGYFPTTKFHLLNHPEHRVMIPAGVEGYRKGTGTVLGASPSEIAFRGGSDRRKRWAST